MPNDAALEGEILPDNRQLPTTPVLPAELYLLPLTEKPFFPAQTLPLLMNEAPWLETVEDDRRNRASHGGPGAGQARQHRRCQPEDFHNIGTLVRMHHPVRTDGKIQFIAEGTEAFPHRQMDFRQRRPTWCRSNTRRDRAQPGFE